MRLRFHLSIKKKRKIMENNKEEEKITENNTEKKKITDKSREKTVTRLEQIRGPLKKFPGLQNIPPIYHQATRITYSDGSQTIIDYGLGRRPHITYRNDVKLREEEIVVKTEYLE